MSTCFYTRREKKDIILSVLHVWFGKKNTSPSVSTPQRPIVCGSKRDETQVLINPQFWSQRPENRKPLSLPQMARFWWRIWLLIHSEAPQSWQAFTASWISPGKWPNDMRVTSPMRPDDAQRLSTGVNNRRLQIAKNIRCGDCLIICKNAQLTFTKSLVGQYFLQLSLIASLLFLLINAAVGQISPLCTRPLFLIAHPCSSREGMGHFKQPSLSRADIHWRRREYFDFDFVFRSSWLLSFFL